MLLNGIALATLVYRHRLHHHAKADNNNILRQEAGMVIKVLKPAQTSASATFLGGSGVKTAAHVCDGTAKTQRSTESNRGPPSVLA